MTTTPHPWHLDAHAAQGSFPIAFCFHSYYSHRNNRSKAGPAAPDTLGAEVAEPGEATSTPRASQSQPRAPFPCPLPPTVLRAEQGGRATPPTMQAGAGAASGVPRTWLATFHPGLRWRAGTLASSSDEAGVRCSPTLVHPFSPPLSHAIHQTRMTDCTASQAGLCMPSSPQ